MTANMEASYGRGVGDGAYGGRGPEVLGVAWALMGVTTIVILLRLYTRITTTHEGGTHKDKYTLTWTMFAWLFGVIGTSFLSVATHYGYGNDNNIIEIYGDLSKALICYRIWSSLNAFMIVWDKFAVAALFLEVQLLFTKLQKYLLISLVTINLFANLANVFVVWFQCKPLRKAWESSVPGSCRLEDVSFDFSIFIGSWNAFVNLYLTASALRITYNLQLPHRLQITLSPVLALGVLTCVCACMRTYELHVQRGSTNVAYDSVPGTLWNIAESWLLLTACGMPTLWPLFKAGISSSVGLQLLMKDVNGNGSTCNSKASSEPETCDSSRTSATYASTDPSTHTSTANSIIIGPDLEGAIAVKREVTVDRERREQHHGWRPRVKARSWAVTNDGRHLTRFGSTRTTRSPSWARGM